MWAEVLLLPCRAGLRLLPPLRLRHRAPGAMKLQSPQFQALFTPGLRSVAGECGPAPAGRGGGGAGPGHRRGPAASPQSVPACCGVRRSKMPAWRGRAGCAGPPAAAVGAALIPSPGKRAEASVGAEGWLLRSGRCVVLFSSGHFKMARRTRRSVVFISCRGAFIAPEEIWIHGSLCFARNKPSAFPWSAANG